MLHNKLGKIAETYEELQGIGFIESIFDTLSRDNPNILELQYRIYLVNAELIHINCSEIAERMNKLEEAQKLSPAHLAWIDAGLQLSKSMILEIIFERNLSHETSIVEQPQILSGFQKFISAYDHYCSSVISILHKKKKTIRSDVASGSSYSATARAINSIKNNYININRIKHDTLCISKNDELNWIPNQLMYNTIFDLTLSGDTAFAQFRLYHQIPELLSRFILRIIEKTNESKDKNPLYILKNLQIMNKASELIIMCISPLRNNLMPSDYYIIRENLGKTSGSKSISIRKKLLSLEWSTLVNLTKNDCAPADIQQWIERESCRFYKSLQIWREEHLLFPRNFLGGHGTKSLIGSPDGLAKATEWLNRTYENKPTVPHFSKDQLNHAFDDYCHGIEDLDEQLLDLTAQIAQNRFPDVQERTGFFK